MSSFANNECECAYSTCSNNLEGRRSGRSSPPRTSPRLRHVTVVHISVLLPHLRVCLHYRITETLPFKTLVQEDGLYDNLLLRTCLASFWPSTVQGFTGALSRSCELWRWHRDLWSGLFASYHLPRTVAPWSQPKFHCLHDRGCRSQSRQWVIQKSTMPSQSNLEHLEHARRRWRLYSAKC